MSLSFIIVFRRVKEGVTKIWMRFYFGKLSDISPHQTIQSTATTCRASCAEQMRTCILFLLVGTALSGLALELSLAAEKDEEQAIDGNVLDRLAVSNNIIENVFELEEAIIPADHRRLQLRLQDASKEELVARSDIAYAAVLMDDHDRGIRTLGQSLIDSRTPADLVAILAPGVTKEAERRMRSQGWIIRRLALDGAVGEVVLDVDSADGSVSRRGEALGVGLAWVRMVDGVCSGRLLG